MKLCVRVGNMLLDLADCDRLRVMPVNDHLALILAGRRRGDAVAVDAPNVEEAIAAFVCKPDELPNAIDQASQEVEEIFLALNRGDRTHTVRRCVEPDEPILKAAGLFQTEVDPPERPDGYPEPKRFILRLKMGDSSSPREFRNMWGRRIERIEVSGSGPEAVVAIITEGPKATHASEAKTV